jgi:hypothetical protein
MRATSLQGAVDSAAPRRNVNAWTCRKYSFPRIKVISSPHKFKSTNTCMHRVAYIVYNKADRC